jgi:hypothetical protein
LAGEASAFSLNPSGTASGATETSQSETRVCSENRLAKIVSLRECLGDQREPCHPTQRVRFGLLGLHAEGEQRRLGSNRLFAAMLSNID